MKKRWEKKIVVKCKNCGFVDEKKVEFINIEEDFQGADKLTFRCVCGKVMISRRYG